MKTYLALVLALTTAACVEPPADGPADVADREAYTIEQVTSVMADSSDEALERIASWCNGDASMCCATDGTIDLCCVWFEDGWEVCF